MHGFAVPPEPDKGRELRAVRGRRSAARLPTERAKGWLGELRLRSGHDQKKRWSMLPCRCLPPLPGAHRPKALHSCYMHRMLGVQEWHGVRSDTVPAGAIMPGLNSFKQTSQRVLAIDRTGYRMPSMRKKGVQVAIRASRKLLRPIRMPIRAVLQRLVGCLRVPCFRLPALHDAQRDHVRLRSRQMPSAPRVRHGNRSLRDPALPAMPKTQQPERLRYAYLRE